MNRERGSSNLKRPTSKDGKLVLTGEFHRHPQHQDGLRYHVLLYENKLILEVGGKSMSVSMGDVVGCEVVKKKGNTEGTPKSVFFCIYAYHLKNSWSVVNHTTGLARQREEYMFEVEERSSHVNNIAIAKRWQTAIQWLIRSESKVITGKGVSIPKSLPPERNFLCFVNPNAGKGRCLKIFLERVKPVFIEASITSHLVITERKNHAREYVRNITLEEWSAIIMVAGDGLPHEVYNGLMERPDAESAIKMPVGIIPGGSADGLARSLCYATGEPFDKDPILACTINCVRGRVHPLDLCQIETPGQSPIYSCLSVGWGILTDREMEAEKLRFVGALRFHLWALWRVCRLRVYSGRVSYLPDAKLTCVNVPIIKSGSRKIAKKLLGPESSPLQRSPSPIPIGLNPKNPIRKSRSKSLWTLRGRKEDKKGLHERSQSGLKYYDGQQVLRGQQVLKGRGLRAMSSPKWLHRSKGMNANEPDRSPIPVFSEPVPDSWKVEEGRFIIVHGSLLSHVSSNLLMAPPASLDDGVCWLLPMQGGMSRLQLLTFLFRNSKSVQIPNVRLLPVRAFRLENFKQGTLTVDGEIVNARALQARVLPGKARVLVHTYT